MLFSYSRIITNLKNRSICPILNYVPTKFVSVIVNLSVHCRSGFGKNPKNERLYVRFSYYILKYVCRYQRTIDEITEKGEKKDLLKTLCRV